MRSSNAAAKSISSRSGARPRSLWQSVQVPKTMPASEQACSLPLPYYPTLLRARREKIPSCSGVTGTTEGGVSSHGASRPGGSPTPKKRGEVRLSPFRWLDVVLWFNPAGVQPGGSGFREGGRAGFNPAGRGGSTWRPHAYSTASEKIAAEMIQSLSKIKRVCLSS